MSPRVAWQKGKDKDKSLFEWRRFKYPDSEIFVEDSTYPQHSLKERILLDKLILYICNICNIGPIWREKPMPLVLDHINGKSNDNRLDNLRFVCSNCDTQLPTYKSKNKRKIN